MVLRGTLLTFALVATSEVWETEAAKGTQGTLAFPQNAIQFTKSYFPTQPAKGKTRPSLDRSDPERRDVFFTR